MRQFLKFMLASMVGTFLIGFVLIMVFIGSLAALGSSFSMEGKPTTVKDGSILHLKLDKVIVDRGSKDQFMLDFGPFRDASKLGMNTILATLEHAKTDDKIKGIFLDLTSTQAGFATMKEIREKIIAFKQESSKPVIAYSESYTQGSYYLATAADAIYLQPKGDLTYHGLQSEYMFYKGLFEKLDIDVQFIRGSNNRFKSFGEVFTEDHMSEANKEQNRALLTGLWAEHRRAVAENRKLEPARLDLIADSLMVRNADSALELGMVDGVKYRDEVLDILRERMGIEADKDLELTELGTYARSFKHDHSTGNSDQKLAVIYAEGGISSGESEDGTIGSTSLSATIREAREDSSIKAIVLRVNSPGGSGLASETIWREVKLANDVKPVVVSMGDVAASGGYYIAAPARKIFAEPTTITGSIGVFGIIPNMQGFFKNKLGITFDGLKTHKYADMPTGTRPLTQHEKDIIQGYIDDFYTGFKERVAEGRNLTVAQVDSIGQGRVWTGEDAKRIGLVDELGGLEAAIAEAANLAGLSDPKRVEMPEQKDLFEQIMADLNGSASAWVAATMLGEDLDLLKQFTKVKQAKEMIGVQARMEYDLDVH
ncbi:MAG: signal peptide peptidase SppA [Flavobacteriales bacterium]|nr:signal peptide peptidase SppA [Flavobacteriales bacterium]MBP6642942.1 signal peptide peptidase SppA [Flavobacteriales bacterium]MBP7154841.1 signal peptide peptidase SppA [Flavobacteriales bacterium]HQV75803.1 signal peptide peptidase SppA [Flavobacteriales bacterium]HQW41488.1 signal peptide peptidase SppA [Flavobacteriales bacterium]